MTPFSLASNRTHKVFCCDTKIFKRAAEVRIAEPGNITGMYINLHKCIFVRK
jgi:hypothetical protein